MKKIYLVDIDRKIFRQIYHPAPSLPCLQRGDKNISSKQPQWQNDHNSIKANFQRKLVLEQTTVWLVSLPLQEL